MPLCAPEHAIINTMNFFDRFFQRKTESATKKQDPVLVAMTAFLLNDTVESTHNSAPYERPLPVVTPPDLVTEDKGCDCCCHCPHYGDPS